MAEKLMTKRIADNFDLVGRIVGKAVLVGRFAKKEKYIILFNIQNGFSRLNLGAISKYAVKF